MIENIYFKEPMLLWLLVGLFIIMIFIKINKSSTNQLEAIFCDDVLDKMVTANSGLSSKLRQRILLGSMFFMIIALSRPVIDNGEIKVKSSFINTVVAIDMSKSMFSDDVYPSRFEFAKKKFMDMLMYIKNTKVAIIGFSSQTFLISPLTQDYHSLKYLTTNLSIDNLTLKGTDILNTLKTTNELFESEQKDGLSLNQNKILILFTDGGDSKSFDDEIEYAKAHNISVYIYNIGTSKGGVIKDTKGDILKDDKNNIVVTKINTYIKELALKSGGAYLEYSLDSKDIKMITANITQKFKAKEEDNNTIKDTKELFYYPLLVAILLYIIGLFSLPNLSKKDI